MVAELQAAFATGVELNEIEHSVRRMAAEVGGHFVHEERLMRMAHYPAYAWHRRQHATARSKLDDLAGQFRDGDRASIALSLESLAGWFNNHIGVTDCMASSYLRNHERECGARGKAVPRRGQLPL
jgi:hemerythrin-like metal-binding protein